MIKSAEVLPTICTNDSLSRISSPSCIECLRGVFMDLRCARATWSVLCTMPTCFAPSSVQTKSQLRRPRESPARHVPDGWYRLTHQDHQETHKARHVVRGCTSAHRRMDCWTGSSAVQTVAQSRQSIVRARVWLAPNVAHARPLPLIAHHESAPQRHTARLSHRAYLAWSGSMSCASKTFLRACAQHCAWVTTVFLAYCAYAA